MLNGIYNHRNMEIKNNVSSGPLNHLNATAQTLSILNQADKFAFQKEKQIKNNVTSL